MSLLDAFRGAWNYVVTPVVPEVYKPTYEKPVVMNPDGTVKPFVNEKYFATKETAEWAAKEFKAEGIVELYFNLGPYAVVNGESLSLQTERFLIFPDGLRVNAGLVAYVYENNAVAGFMRTAHFTAKTAAQRYIDLKRLEVKLYPGAAEYEDAAIKEAMRILK